MRSYAETKVLTASDLMTLRYATALVDRVPQALGGKWVRCHELARAVGEGLELPVVDGSYGACDHSWLMLPTRVILDVYVPARVPQVQLCPYWVGAPAMYRSGEARSDVRSDVTAYLVSRMRDGLSLLLEEVDRSARIDANMRDGAGACSRWDELPAGRRAAVMHEAFSRFGRGTATRRRAEGKDDDHGEREEEAGSVETDGR